MAVTLSDVVVPKGVWTDLYAGSGVAVGTAVTVINTGSNVVQLAIKLTAPTLAQFGVPLYPGPSGSTAQVDPSEVGLWAYSAAGVAYINVQE